MSALRVVRDEEPPIYDAGQADAESATQKTGYIRAYREIVTECGAMPAMLYGIIEDMIQIGSRTGLGCIMSHAAMAAELGVSGRAVRRYLQVLRETGWLLWEEASRGGVNRYYLPAKRATVSRPDAPTPPAKSTDTPGQIGHTPRTKSPNPPANLADNLTVTNKQERPTGNGVTPFGLFALVCDEAGLDIGGYSERDKGKHMAVAKRLIAAGVDEADVRGVVRWLRGQTWRHNPVTLFVVENELGDWRAQGRPGPERAAGKKLNPNSAAWSRQTGKAVV